MLESLPSLSATTAGYRDLRLQEEVDAANAEFVTFAETNLRQLIEVEEAKLGVPSSLRVLARLDIGIWQDGNGRLSYFVNSVVRGPGTSLWSRDEPRILGMVGPHIASSLRTWLERYMNNRPCVG
jgi:hypothetical protein